MLLHVEWSSWRRQPEEGKERGKRRQGEREDGEEEGEEDQATAPWQAESQPALGPLPLLGCNGRFCRSAFSATSPHYVRARPFQPWAASDKFVSGCAVLLLSCYKCPSFKAVSTLRAPSNFQVPSFALCPAGKASHERFTAAMRRITYS